MASVVSLSIRQGHNSSYSSLTKHLVCHASDINKHAVDLKHTDS